MPIRVIAEWCNDEEWHGFWSWGSGTSGLQEWCLFVHVSSLLINFHERNLPQLPRPFQENHCRTAQSRYAGQQVHPNLVAKPFEVSRDYPQLGYDQIKARRFDSSWNWVRQDALVMFYDIILRRLTTVDCEITAHCISLLHHADPELLTCMQYHIDQVDPSKGDTYQLAKQFGQQLVENTWGSNRPTTCVQRRQVYFYF